MLYELRQKMSNYLATHQICILCGASQEGNWAIPVIYHSQDVQVTCLLPRWADAAYYLEQDQGVLLIVPDSTALPLRWLQMSGQARLETGEWVDTCWPAVFATQAQSQFYLRVSITPQRVDWVDESQRWGILDTLDVYLPLGAQHTA